MHAYYHTGLSQFILLSLSEDPEVQSILFGLFLSMYLVKVLGNLLIILATNGDSHLHTSMYFFLCSLSLVDIGVISTTVAKMLVNIQAQKKDISYTQCLTQNFSTSTEIPHFFCKLAQLLKFGNSEIFVNNIFLYVAIVQMVVFPVWWIFFSYFQIVSFLMKISSTTSKYKAFSTCLSHLCVFSFFYGTGFGGSFSSDVIHSSQGKPVASVMYTVVTPMLNTSSTA
ncbi:Olfactory receptor 1073 [Heterocephalus glaber]|uniref:Olfactory receptor 1073 n=1 Tax=Heterocephalus glaber TaxID=10181 RepID=G5B6E6_HETGA|nr:Olfactory receptor 1073 [Heterocephalus glaber]